jgi:hypothetical protein
MNQRIALRSSSVLQDSAIPRRPRTQYQSNGSAVNAKQAFIPVKSSDQSEAKNNTEVR